MSRIWIAVGFLFCVVAGSIVILLASKRPEPDPALNDTPDAAQGEIRALADTPPVFDTYVSKTTGMKFVRIKAGTFMMGTPASEKSRVAPDQDETQHEVTLRKDFYLGIYEVTRGEFRKFVESTGYETEAETDDGGRGWIASRNKTLQQQEFNWQNTGFEQTDNYPVVNVTDNDALKFTGWLSRKDGRTYRLPTEKEWEYACRGGTTTRFSFGDDNEWNKENESVARYANTADASYHRTTDKYVSNNSDDGYAFTSPVGQFRPNAFGLYDMHGNVWELCSDWYGAYPGGRVADYYRRDPKPARVSRGGSCIDAPHYCRSAARGMGTPDFRSYASGFRLVMDPDSKQAAEKLVDVPPKPKPVIETTVSKSTGMKFVRIKAGKFTMGLPKSDPDRQDAWAHEVTLTQDFHMGVHEVTRGQFRKFVEETSYTMRDWANGGLVGWNAEKKKWEHREDFNWLNTGFEQTDDHPVVNVSWKDAVNFAAWLSRKDGRKYRLPTEAEWEYACRGRSTSKYHFGNDWADKPRFANTADASLDRTANGAATYFLETASFDDGYAFTAPVGRFLPNKFGLFDMHGNVAEWCSDWEGEYPRDPVTDPQGPQTGSRHMTRGGGWYTRDCGSAFRKSHRTEDPDYGLGFRLVFGGFEVEPAPQDPSKPSEKAEEIIEVLRQKKKAYVSIDESDGAWRVDLESVEDWKSVIPLLLELDRVDELKLGKAATDALVAELLPKFPRLRKLSLYSNNTITDASLANLKGLTELRHLDLGSCRKLTKAGMANLAGLKALEILDLSNVSVEDGAKHLATLTNLTELDLYRSNLKGSHIAALASLAKLKKLELTGNEEFGDDGLAPIARMMKLEELELQGTAVTDDGLKSLAGLPSLFRLDLWSTKVSDAGLEHLGKIPHLKNLTLSNTAVKGRGLKFLAGLKELESIDFQHLPEFTGEGLGHLAGCPKFQSLNLSWTGLTDDGLADIKKLQQLKSLDLPPYGWPTALGGKFWQDPHPERFSDKGLKHIGEMPNLEWLWLSGSGPTDEGVAHLAGCKNLQTLTLFVTPNIKGPGLAALKALPNLKRLTLRESGVTDDGLKHLKELKQLEFISPPKNASAKAVGHLKGMKQLKEIRCSQEFDPKAIAELKAALPEADIYQAHD